METINLLHEVTNAMKQLQSENDELRNQMASLQNEHAEMRIQMVSFKSQLDQLHKTMDHEKESREEQKERLDKVETQVEKATETRYEKYYQRHLERMLGAGHSITKHGYTDIETEDAIYEIKRQNQYKNVVGQLKAYGVGKDHKRLVAALFGDIPPTKEPEIVSLLNANQIHVIKLIDLPDGSVLMKEIGKKVGEESADDLTSPIAIIKCFVAQKCEITKDKKDKIFSKDLWDVFIKWKKEKKLIHVKHVKQHSLYKHIDGLTEYNNKGKVLINNERTTGWYGLKLK